MKPHANLATPRTHKHARIEKQDDGTVNLYLPVGHVMNPYEYDLVRHFAFHNYKDGSHWVYVVEIGPPGLPSYRYFLGSGLSLEGDHTSLFMLAKEAKKLGLVNIIRREYRKAYGRAKRKAKKTGGHMVQGHNPIDWPPQWPIHLQQPQQHN